MPELSYFFWGRLFDDGPAMGLIVNIFLAILALIGGGLIGVPLGILRATAPAPALLPISLFLTVVRGTPLLLLLLWTFLLIQVVLAAPLAPIWIGCLALGLYAMTHVSDIIRAGAGAVPRQQIRSAQALGLSPLTIAYAIILPVSVRLMIPSLTTFATSLFKDTSVCYVIGVVDLVQLALLETSRNPRFLLEYYSLMAFLFLMFNLIGTRLAARLEHRARIRGLLT